MAKKVLICDDAEYMRASISKILTKEGYEIIEAADGNESVDQYKKHKPDIVLMDVTMPEKDGFLALKEIMEYDSSAKVVMCSAMGLHSIVEDSLAAGAIDYIIKPFQPDRVIEAVRKVVG